MYCFLTVKMCVVPYDHSEPSISDITFQICAPTPQLKVIVHNIIKQSSKFCSFTLFNVHHISPWCLQTPEEASDLWNGNYYGNEPPCERWKSKLSHLQEQQTLKNASASLQSLLLSYSLSFDHLFTSILPMVLWSVMQIIHPLLLDSFNV